MKKLTTNGLNKNLGVMALALAMLILPLAAFGQTKISMPRNKNDISKDIEIGRKSAAEVDKTFPMVNDRTSDAYINEVGNRLANAVPPEFQHREFNCKFKIVNASDINAFALPACWLYVNRGMIEAAKNEGEMAGVMAHEISHAMLRHGTAQGPGALSTIGALGAILGGAVIGAPELGQVVAAGIMTPYSRAFEKQADILGANIMARAGYDPRDLANMFKTIAGEGGGRTPEWISTHPDPGNRYNYINQEADMLRVSPNPIKITQGFQRAQQYMRSLPKAKTMEEIEKAAQGNTQGGQDGGQGSGQTSPTAGGKYSNNVPYPSTSYTTFNTGGLYVNYPNNWRNLPGNGEVFFVPEGAYGDNGITHGVWVGLKQGQGGNLQQETDAYVKSLIEANKYQATSNYVRTTLNGRNGLAISAQGRSDITGATEVVTFYTSQTSGGNLLYVITVSPQSQANSYSSAFNKVVRSVRYSGQ